MRTLWREGEQQRGGSRAESRGACLRSRGKMMRQDGSTWQWRQRGWHGAADAQPVTLQDLRLAGPAEGRINANSDRNINNNNSY